MGVDITPVLGDTPPPPDSTMPPALIEPEVTAPPTSELRLALAMRGGVSLAVWIGGASAEINALRLSKSSQHEEGPSAVFYRPLVRACSYSGVVVDVISGASAGGLNGAILSAALTRGLEFGRMRQLWLELGDIEKLMRQPTDRSPLSLLKGDSYFLKSLFEQLNILIPEPTPPSRPSVDRLDLFLAATLVNPVKVDIAEPFERMVDKRQTAFFHFRKHGPSGCLSDFDGPRETLAYRLALGARTTSSFPGAFEPARIKALRPRVLAERPEEKEDLFGIFSETSDAEFDVMDGGVLDNIPVGRAIEAVSSAPAQGPVERWLLYLHPSPELAEVPVLPADRPRALKTAIASLLTKANRESILDDIDKLKAHNAVAKDYQRLRRDLLPLPQVKTPETIIAAATSRYEGYRTQRGNQSADETLSLLEDPIKYIGHDPFPEEIGQPVQTWTKEERDLLQEAARDSRIALLPPFVENSDPTRLPANTEELDQLDLGAIERVTNVVLGWVIDTERRLDHLSPTQMGRVQAIGTLKRALHDIRMICAELFRYDAYAWPLAARTTPIPRPGTGGMTAWIENTFNRVSDVLFLHPQDNPDGAASPATTIVELLQRYLERAVEELNLDPGEEARETVPAEDISRDVAAAVCALESVITQRLESPTSPTGGSVNLRRELWLKIVAIAKAAKLVTSGADLADPGPDQDAIFEAMDVAPTASAEQMSHFLGAMEILLFSFQIIFPPTQRIELLQVSAAAPTPLAQYFPDGALSVKDKLAGNEIANFAAFYKASWRANDWMWGRMDTAKSLIDVLIRPDRLRPHGTFIKDPAAYLSRLLHSIVTAPVPLENLTPEQQTAWIDHFEEDVWGPREAAIVVELAALFATPPEPTNLQNTKEVLVERRHWEILLNELPIVVQSASAERLAYPEDAATGESRLHRAWRRLQLTAARLKALLKRGPVEPLIQAVMAVERTREEPLRHPDGIKDLLGRYTVGMETIQGDAWTKRFTEVAANLSLVGWKALTPAKPPWLLRPIGWVVRVVRGLALTSVNAPRLVMAILPLLAVLATQFAFSEKETFDIGQLGWGLVAVGAIGLLIFWMTSLARIFLFFGLFGGLVWATWPSGGDLSFTLSFQDKDLVSSGDAAVFWLRAAIVFLVGGLLFRVAPYIQRKIIAWVSTGLAAIVVLLSQTVLRDEIANKTWILWVALIAVTLLPALAELAFDWVRRKKELDANLPTTPRG